MASRSDIEAGRAFVRIYTKNSDLTKGLRAAAVEVDKFGNKLLGIGQRMLAIGAIASTPFALATKSFADFDDQMRAVNAVSELTAKELQTLTGLAKKLGATSSYSATEVASLMTELGRAGFTGQQIEQMTKAVIDLARASGTDATLAAGIM